MKKIFKYKKVNKCKYLVETKSSNMVIGELIQDVDGYFYFFLNNYNGGAFTSQILDEISNKLDELNHTWNDTINKHFNKK